MVTEGPASSPSIPQCGDVPDVFSSFVDAFVDFSVSGGLFLPQTPDGPSPGPQPSRLPAPSRLVAIGDLHGDLLKAKAALSVAGILNPRTDRWSGGPSVAVQVGDVLDRGGDEIRLLYLLHRLKSEAARSGGALLTIHGNHEIMNMELNFRYSTPEGFAEFEDWARWYCAGIAMKARCGGLEKPENPFRGIPKSFRGVKSMYWEGMRARIAALRPNGPLTRRFLAENQTVVVVGDSLFVHGGLSEDHARYGIDRINEEVRDWVRGAAGRTSPGFMKGKAAVWSRQFSDGRSCNCEDLEGVLLIVPGAARMVMGHTIQDGGINAVCGDRAVRIDVGLSRGCGDGLPEVLEISGGRQMRVLSSVPAQQRKRHEGKKGLALLMPENQRGVEVKA